MTSQAIELEKYKLGADVKKFSVVPKTAELQTEILTGGVELIEKLSAEWIDLCEEGASNEPFFRPEWFAAFVRNFEREVMFLTIRRGGKLRAILPLVRSTESLHGIPVRKLRAVFNLQTPRSDLIHGADEAERDAIIENLWREMKNISGWDVFEIRLVKEGSWLEDLLRLAKQEKYRTGSWKMDCAPYVLLPQSDDKKTLTDNYFKNLSKNRRQLIKKKRRSLEELGTLEAGITRGYSPELMQKYFTLEAQSWKGRAGTAVTSDERFSRLHEDFARAVAERDALSFHELKLNGQTIAMFISISFGRQAFGWKMSYDENYAKHSPGNVLFIEVLNECMRDDSPELDQLSPATYNKSLWADGFYEHSGLYIFRRGIFGSLLWNWKFSLIAYLRKFKKPTPSTAE